MALRIPDVFQQRLFGLGFGIRVILLCLVTCPLRTQLFLPFLTQTAGTLDPWSWFLKHQGISTAFPYGPVMYLLCWPAGVVGQWVGSTAAQTMLALVVLMADTATLWMLDQLALKRRSCLLWFYWLSPIVLYIGYWHGQLDAIPVALAVSALWALRHHRPQGAATGLALAVGAKLSMLLLLPFLLAYILRNTRLTLLRTPFLLTLAILLLVVGVFPLWSSGYRHMVIDSPEFGKVAQLQFSLGSGSSLFLAPAVYLLLVFGAWRMQRLSFSLLTAFLCLAFFSIVLLTPASPGWFLWSMPLLALHLRQQDRFAQILAWAFSALYIVLHLGLLPPSVFGYTIPIRSVHAAFVVSSLSTLVAVVGLLLAAFVAQDGIAEDGVFRLSRRPLLLGIAGDSGTGKDTLVDGLELLLGRQAMSRISGDWFHRWDRFGVRWKTMTHLNPQANDLDGFSKAVLGLAARRHVTTRPYDHTSGRFQEPISLPSKDVVVASGLHTLLPKDLCERCDTSVFMAMDESLRRYLKLWRDVQVRGHDRARVLASIELRQDDYQRYVLPQIKHAQVVFCLMPLSSDILLLEPQPELIRTKLKVYLRHTLRADDLIRVLIATCGLHVDAVITTDFEPWPSEMVYEITLEGEAQGDDFAAAADLLMPGLDAFLDLNPQWLAGMSGAMQLILLLEIHRAIQHRIPPNFLPQ